MDGDSPILPLIMTVSAQGAGSVIIFYAILFVLLVMGGAYFAGAEMALASVNRIRMMSLEDNGDKRARRVLYILDNFDKALSTILIGNNIMHIGCATIATLIATKLWGEGAVAYSTIITTVVLFFVSEMLPKFYAKACNERMALSVAGSLVFLMKALTPLSFLFTKFSREVSKPFVEAAEEEPTVTEDELHDIIETGVEEGSIDDEKGELMQSALEFSGTLVRDVYTPWSSVVTVSANMSASDIAATIKNCQYSRLPYIDKHGRVIGVLHIRRFLKRFIAAGMVPGDKILIMPGDNSSVPQMRNDGFFGVLLENGWTQEQVDAIESTAYTGWSRSEGKKLFTEWLDSSTVDEILETKWIFTHDDEIAMGILEALKSSEIDTAKKDAFLSAITVITKDGAEDILLHLPELTDDERQILLEGCLMNFYAANSKKETK